jgi:NAD(P)H-nitrite reductase large subunit
MQELLEMGNIEEEDQKAYAVAPYLTQGIVTPEELRRLADVAEKYHAAAIKVTEAKKIAIVGLKEEDIDAAWQELEMRPETAIGLCIRNVKICPGVTYCKMGFQDAIAVGTKLDEYYHEKELPCEVKMGISGCPNSCSDSRIRDIGLIGGLKGWMVYIGGKGGSCPKLGERIAVNVTEEKVFELIDKMLRVYCEQADQKETFGDYLGRVGIEAFKKEINITLFI